MTSDEARDRFSDAYDGELGPDQAAFDAALAADDALRAEFEEFRSFLNETHSLLGGPGPEGPADVPEVDLLAGIQEKIRVRSRGRYYRDRWSRRTGAQATLPILLGALMLLLLGVALFGLQLVQEVEEGQGGPPPALTDR